jgi:hypothetical protein
VNKKLLNLIPRKIAQIAGKKRNCISKFLIIFFRIICCIACVGQQKESSAFVCNSCIQKTKIRPVSVIITSRPFFQRSASVTERVKVGEQTKSTPSGLLYRGVSPTSQFTPPKHPPARIGAAPVLQEKKEMTNDSSSFEAVTRIRPTSPPYDNSQGGARLLGEKSVKNEKIPLARHRRRITTAEEVEQEHVI